VLIKNVHCETKNNECVKLYFTVEGLGHWLSKNPWFKKKGILFDVKHKIMDYVIFGNVLILNGRVTDAEHKFTILFFLDSPKLEENCPLAKLLP